MESLSTEKLGSIATPVPCWTEDSFVLEFSQMSKRSRAIEAWEYPDGSKKHDNCEIEESEVPSWLKHDLPVNDHGQTPSAGLRILTQKNDSGFPYFPFERSTFNTMLDEWKFPALELHWNAFYVGGSAVFTIKSDEGDKINFIFGGGVYSYSIGGIFSYDCRTNVTSGCLISGANVKPWAELIPIRFGNIPGPFTIPILMADILITRAVDLRRNFVERMLHVESQTGSGPGAEEVWPARLLMPQVAPDYRMLAIELSNANRLLGLTVMSVARARLMLEFIMENSKPEAYDVPLPSQFKETGLILRSRAQFMLSSLEYIKAEQDNAPTRLQSQNMVVTNLVAQQDMALTMEVARDSRELAAASRRDSSAMRVIAVLGTVFLPGTFTATVLALPLFKWDAKTSSGVFSTRLWIYFVITIPLTAITMTIIFYWLKYRERRSIEIATKARTRGELEGTADSEEVEMLFAEHPNRVV